MNAEARAVVGLQCGSQLEPDACTLSVTAASHRSHVPFVLTDGVAQVLSEGVCFGKSRCILLIRVAKEADLLLEFGDTVGMSTLIIYVAFTVCGYNADPRDTFT